MLQIIFISWLYLFCLQGLFVKHSKKRNVLIKPYYYIQKLVFNTLGINSHPEYGGIYTC